jgi:ADP-dependent NAD(P)H-hydrate dehydratase / NAD(P)H-hydrate epimerase
MVEHKTVLAIGPGISRHTETAEFVHTIVGKYKTAMVVDADGLNAFEDCAEKLKGGGRPLVITPHPGEMARLINSTVAAVQRDRLNVARSFARDHNLIVVLKGHRTLIASADGTIWVNTTGNPGMATGGTGDILTGMVAGLVAQHPSHLLEAVVAAVHLHGLSGDIARDVLGEESLVATDLVKFLPQAFHRVRRDARERTVRISP